ncbi:biliverdin-producing heme oxygenase [Piscinibacter sp. HJYY11]|nr:biliverdin-producing heme oxygenase [Piscinibacter sp. HJYY11]
MNELRDKTRTEHTRIESVLRLTQPMSVARYAGVMTGFHEFLRRWEPRLASTLPSRLHDWSARRKRSGFAADDLRHLHAPHAPQLAEAAERAVRSIPMGDTAAALGSMYVIEGSALGGQVIAPMLKAHLGLTPAGGASYFHGHGPATGAMWRDFREVITRELGHDEAAARTACHSARHTFSALCDVFEGLPA